MAANGAAKPEDIELKPGAIGAFEIFIDGQKRYSKLATGRFPDEKEIDGLA